MTAYVGSNFVVDEVVVRVHSLRIKNFRAIEAFEATELQDFIVIAGPNGCGKTTVLDALRLVKSIYVPNEYIRWFQEFGIDLNRPHNFSTLFRDPDKPIDIEAEVLLSEAEAKFLHTHAYNIALGLCLASDRKSNVVVTGDRPIISTDLSPENVDAIQSDAEKFANQITEALECSSIFKAGVRLISEPDIEQAESPIANAAFTCFRPDCLGEIEFHSSRRSYFRDPVSSIRLNVGDRSEERRSRLLFDIENKYKNIKTQLGEEYIAAILRKEEPEYAPLHASIKELFKSFFPGKEFNGISVADDNSMKFPVQLDTGETHDIDELSSGEKEIVYGYLWLRTGTPRGSIVLVDEPELHLNPALVQGLPNFYEVHLAEALDAQVWIVTHSDAILRQAVRAPAMTVYHMARPHGDGTEQAIRIDSQDAVEAAVLDLIGDLAAYRPYAKIVLVEGNKETRFDVDMIRRLFPDMAEKGNFLPVGSRRMTSGVRVRLLEVLAEAGLSQRAVSITDGDLGLDSPASESGTDHFTWPVYEIENFLLEPQVLRGASEVLLGDCPFKGDGDVIDCLRKIAEHLVQELARDEVQHILNNEFITAVSIGASKEDPIAGLWQSSEASQSRVLELDVSEDRIVSIFDESSARLREHLKSDEFLVRFPGDRLLRALAGNLKVNGDHFRNACVDQAQRLELRPPGMEETLQRALA